MKKLPSFYSKVGVLGLLLGTSALTAGPISINITDPTLSSLGAGQALENEINSEFKVPQMGDFLKSMANAQAIANKGLGVSYATEHSLFVAGGNFGLGTSFVDTSSFSLSTSGGLPAIGVGVQASGMLGISLSKLPMPALGPIDPKRLTLFINYFGISNDSIVKSLTIKANTFGMHAQYRIIEAKNLGGIGILNWGGLAFTTGFDVSTNSLTYKVGQSLSTDVSGSTVTWTPNSSSNLTLEANSFTIPLELSTSVRVLYILSLFGGAGIDLNMGKSTISANLNGTISSTGTVNNPNAGTASLVISESQNPSFGHLRFFSGVQFNIVPLKNTNLLSVYAQGNISLGGHYGAHAGVRIAW